MTDQPIRRALLSVYDKSDLQPFARALHQRGIELISTGGTAQALRDDGLPVTDVAELTQFPEMLDGRVKTLHPAVHGGLLARRDASAHLEALKAQGIALIDLLVVNLYPFEATVDAGSDPESCVEMIDIGGPAMLRAAAKNHAAVTVVVDAGDYDSVLAELHSRHGCTGLTLRQRLAAKVFRLTAGYDAVVADWFGQRSDERLPERLTLTGMRTEALRYGENPHQDAAFYRSAFGRQGVASAAQAQGKTLSYNNLNDTDAAFELVADLEDPACAIIKHANPCGVAMAPALVEAYHAALKADPVSAFGGIIACNRRLDAATAREITALFAEVVIAPGAEDDALEILRAKKNLRVLLTDAMPGGSGDYLVRSLAGGFLVQARDTVIPKRDHLQVVSARAPSEDEVRDLLFAQTVAKHVKSNAIVFAKRGATVGIGAGQMSRVDAVSLAAAKARELAATAGEAEARTRGSVVASDAFFPFADGLIAAARAGATAVIQPGGSTRDQEVIDAANEAGLAMVFTGTRHFRH